MSDDIIITTMNDLPGYEIVEVYGEVFGLIVRARNAFSNIGAGFRTLFGGEAKGYTKLLADSRNQRSTASGTRPRERGAQRGHRDALRLQRDRRHHERGRRVRHGGAGAAAYAPPAGSYAPPAPGA